MITAQPDPTIPPLLAAWVDASRVAPEPASRAAARAAMQATVRVAAAAPSRRRRVAPWTARFRPALGRPTGLAAGFVAAAAAVTLAAGWNAGAGSPLHPVQQAREAASIGLAGSTEAAALRLDYAEARLRSAAAGSDPRDNLTEASALLTAAAHDLPADHSDPEWRRWSRDVQVLNALAPAASQPGRGPSGDRIADPGRSRAPDDGGNGGRGPGTGNATRPTEGGDHGGGGGSQGVAPASTGGGSSTGSGHDGAQGSPSPAGPDGGSSGGSSGGSGVGGSGSGGGSGPAPEGSTSGSSGGASTSGSSTGSSGGGSPGAATVDGGTSGSADGAASVGN